LDGILAEEDVHVEENFDVIAEKPYRLQNERFNSKHSMY
jgi:hypothetical protein